MKNKLSMALSLAVIFALIAATFVLADNLLTDGDGLTPVVDTTSLNLGNVCLESTTTKSIAHAISRNGNYNNANVFKKGTTATVSVGVVSGSGLSAGGGGNIAIPTNWDIAAPNTLSPAVFSNVSFVANTLGSFNGTVEYSASGTESDNSSLTRTDSLAVTANVISCDTTAPTLNLPENRTVEATGATGALVTFDATATDTNPLNPSVTCSPASGSLFSLDVTTTVNCSATDAANNTANGSFTIEVVDTTPPTVTPPTSIVAEATSGSGAVVSYSGEYATDVVDGMLAASCEPISGSTFALGSNTVICTATDSHGNIGNSEFTIDVQDTTDPILALPADITAEATSEDGAVVNFTASASDIVDGALDVACDWNDGDTFPLGTTLVSCSATDNNGNTSNGSFNVTVEDTTAPELALPADFAVEATGASGAVATFSASATDLVDGAVAVSCTPASGNTFPLGPTTVDCSSTDAAGNPATGSFIVTVQDTTAPDLVLPADQQLEATSAAGAMATFSPSATDAVDGALTVTCSANSGDTFPLGTTTVDCSVEDAAGNEASGSFVIIVEDTTAPVITFVNRTAANANGWNNGDVTVNWSCTDIVGVVSASDSKTITSEGTNQSATGTCTDTSGNTASDTQTSINIDKTDPTASASRTPDANANGWNNSDVMVSFTGLDDRSGIDFCSVNQVFGEGANQSASGTCTDKAGNVSDAAGISDINVDKTAPTISGAPDRAPNAHNWYNADVTVTFTCNDALSTVDSCTAPVTLGEGANQSVPGSVTDKAGNSANTTVSGINIDETDPIISASLDIFPALSGWFNSSTGAPTVSFECSDALSGLDGLCPADHTFGDGGNQSYNQTVYDLAGNSASDGVSDVDVDTVAPAVSVTLDRDAAASGWFNTSTGAPIAEFTCSDGTSGMGVCPADFTFVEGENQSHSGTAFDNAGNSASASVSDVDVDLTAPSVSAALNLSPAATGWFNASTGAPTVIFTCSDSLSGLNSCPTNYLFGEGGNQTHGGTASDNAGNTASAGVSDVDVDTVVPSISVALDRSAAGTGWFNETTGAPVAKFTCSDATSGVVACPADYTFGNGENQSHSGTVSDNAGNSNSANVSNVDVDLVDPTLTWNGGPANGASFYFGSVPAAPTCSAADALSGPNGCGVTGYSTSTGSHTMTAAAQDVAGNQYSEQRTYTVMAWTLTGFYQPVDMNGVLNVVRNGSTVPLKFELFAGSTELTDVAAVNTLTYAQVVCGGDVLTDEIETLATGGTSLRYDATGGQFIFNWKTPSGTAGKCFRVTMLADDGSSLVAYFKMR